MCVFPVPTTWPTWSTLAHANGQFALIIVQMETHNVVNLFRLIRGVTHRTVPLTNDPVDI